MCLNAKGRPVDWWVALKLPGSEDLAYLDSTVTISDDNDARFT